MSTCESSDPRFFIAFLLPPAVHSFASDVIQTLSDRYHAHTVSAPPHITLQPPFEWPLEALPALEESLQQFAQRYASVAITLEGFGAFSPRVIYIQVQKTPELLYIQTHLMQHLEDTVGILDLKNKRRGFSPHITVASRNLTPETFQQAWAELQPRSADFQFMGDRLTLLVYRGHHWEPQQQFLLCQGKL